jgi:hypothetical protein
MSKVVSNRAVGASTEISREAGPSMPTLKRYRKVYQRSAEDKAEKPVAKKVTRPRRHMAQGASASEIRKALGISKKDLAAARRDLAALDSEHVKKL